MRFLSLVLVVPCLSASLLHADNRPFPLPIPHRAEAPPGVPRRLVNHRGRAVDENLRTRLVERAVERAGGWTRWRELEGLYLKVRRRELDVLGLVTSHQEETLIYRPNSLHRYWEEEGNQFMAGLEGRFLTLVEPPLPRGAPEAVELQRSLERAQFWTAHPFLLHRPGIRTRYAGLASTRGVSAHTLVAEFAPGAAPYRRVEYLFEPVLGDLLRATAYPQLEGEPVEVYHFSGRVRGPEGLRLPRRRELQIDGITRQVVVLLDVATRAPVLPPSAVSREARQRQLLARPR